MYFKTIQGYYCTTGIAQTPCQGGLYGIAAGATSFFAGCQNCPAVCHVCACVCICLFAVCLCVWRASSTTLCVNTHQPKNENNRALIRLQRLLACRRVAHAAAAVIRVRHSPSVLPATLVTLAAALALVTDTQTETDRCFHIRTFTLAHTCTHAHIHAECAMNSWSNSGASTCTPCASVRSVFVFVYRVCEHVSV